MEETTPIKRHSQNLINFTFGAALGMLFLVAMTVIGTYLSTENSFVNIMAQTTTSILSHYTAVVGGQENATSQSTKQNVYYFVPVSSFISDQEKITFDELKSLTLSATEANKSDLQRLLYLKNDKVLLQKTLGFDLLSAVEVESIDGLIQTIEKNDIAIVGFESLVPQLKPLILDDQDIFDDDFSSELWALKIESEVLNRDQSKISTLAMTGVTAISRGVESAIAQYNDPIFPARGVMDVLVEASLTHVNSENPFFDDCRPEREGIVLCGKTRSIEALKSIGTDIVELAGNHQNDYGTEKNLESILHLEEAGFKRFGGGKNEQDAAQILYEEIAGTKIAFMAYAYFDSLNGPQYRSLAYGDRPGANYYSEEKLKSDIEDARKNADVVIVDYQFIEDYSYNPMPGQVDVFRQTIDTGADLVVGVQAHQPQKIEFYEGRPIFYGLGNLFFDQMWSEETRQGLIPFFIFYDDELISIKLYTTLLYDYAQPRFTEGDERLKLLEKILPSQIF